MIELKIIFEELNIQYNLLPPTSSSWQSRDAINSLDRQMQNQTIETEISSIFK